MIIRNRLIETELVKQMTLVVVLAAHHRRLRHKMPLEDGITVRQSLQITSATKSAQNGHANGGVRCRHLANVKFRKSVAGWMPSFSSVWRIGRGGCSTRRSSSSFSQG